MLPKPIAPILALALGCGGCSQFNQAVTVSVAGPAAEAQAARLEPEPEAEAEAGGRGVDPQRALRSAEAATGRWVRQPPSRLSSLPAAFEVAKDARDGTPKPKPEAKSGPAREADAAMRRIERGARAGMGTVCEGC